MVGKESLIIPLFFAMILSIPLVQAQPSTAYPLVYKRVFISLNVSSDGSALVSYKLVMLNEGTVPVVPGYGIIKITGKKVLNAEGLSLKSGRKLDVTVDKDKVKFGVWDVIKPNRSLSVEIRFKISSFVAKGVLFDEYKFETMFSYPTEECRIVITPPKGEHVVSGKDTLVVKNLKPGTPVLVSGEISILPLPKSPVKWYIPFWLIAIGVVATVALLLRRRG